MNRKAVKRGVSKSEWLGAALDALAIGGVSAVRIEDLAKVMIKCLAPEFGHDPEKIELTCIGAKAGEKFYEELMSDEETRRTWELPSMFAVLPAFRGVYHDIEYDYPEVLRRQVTEPYVSSTGDMMTHDEIEDLLVKCHILPSHLASLKPPRIEKAASVKPDIKVFSG